MDNKYANVNVKVEEEKKKKVIKICSENNTTLSREVRKLIEKILRDNEQGVLNI